MSESTWDSFCVISRTSLKRTRGLLDCSGQRKAVDKWSVAGPQRDPFGSVPDRQHKALKYGMAFLEDAVPRIPFSRTGIRECFLSRSTLVCIHTVLLKDCYDKKVRLLLRIKEKRLGSNSPCKSISQSSFRSPRTT